MKLSTYLSALRKCEREYQEYYDADDDQETHNAWHRRARQADKLERKIWEKVEKEKAEAIKNG